MSNAKSTAKKLLVKFRPKPAAQLLRAPVPARIAKSKRVMGLNPR